MNILGRTIVPLLQPQYPSFHGQSRSALHYLVCIRCIPHSIDTGCQTYITFYTDGAFLINTLPRLQLVHPSFHWHWESSLHYLLYSWYIPHSIDTGWQSNIGRSLLPPRYRPGPSYNCGFYSSPSAEVPVQTNICCTTNNCYIFMTYCRTRRRCLWYSVG